MNKKLLIIISVIAIAVTILVTASAVIYNTFFKKNLEMEKAAEIIHEEFDKNQSDADLVAKEVAELAKENGVIGAYVATYNEISASGDESYMYTPTTTVTSVMQLNEDMTVSFNDGQKGWWTMIKDENDIITIDMGVQGEDETRRYMFCNDTLIEITKAVFWGEVPEGATFDAEFVSGNLTMTFEKDGSVEALYSEMVEEDGTSYPWNEAYSGTYQRSGDYIDIVLNGSHAKYMIFKNEGNNPDKPISGFASRYYIKSDI